MIVYMSFRKHFCRLCNENHASWRTAMRHEKLYVQESLKQSNPLIDLSRRKRCASSSSSSGKYKRSLMRFCNSDGRKISCIGNNDAAMMMF